MEHQVSRLIDAMQGLSPEGARIWSEMVAAEAVYNMVMLYTLIVPLIIFGCSVFCFKIMKKDWADGDFCGVMTVLLGIAGTIALATYIFNIPGLITAINHPEGTLAYSIILLLR